jgi:hypothetical protein
VLYIQLVIANPRIANFIFLIIFLGLYIGINSLTGAGLNIDFIFFYLAIIVVCAFISFILSRSLTKERVVLSSKG